MFGRQVSLPMRIARAVLVPYGPVIIVLAVVDLTAVSENFARAMIVAAMAWVLFSLVLVPAMMFRESDSSPGSSEDDGGGGSKRPEPRLPTPGGGGIPIPMLDAEQSRERIRDHVRRERVSWRPRRAAREPHRLPAPGRRHR